MPFGFLPDNPNQQASLPYRQKKKWKAIGIRVDEDTAHDLLVLAPIYYKNGLIRSPTVTAMAEFLVMHETPPRVPHKLLNPENRRMELFWPDENGSI